jgi:hypothetical protein
MGRKGLFFGVMAHREGCFAASAGLGVGCGDRGFGACMAVALGVVLVLFHTNK